jgi:hypothetical protein
MNEIFDLLRPTILPLLLTNPYYSTNSSNGHTNETRIAEHDPKAGVVCDNLHIQLASNKQARALKHFARCLKIEDDSPLTSM